MGPDLEAFLEEYHRSVEAVIRGDPSPQDKLWSRSDDVTLANPFGPPARGWDEVSNAYRRAAAQLSDGEIDGIDRISAYSTDDLAYTLEIERARVRMGGADDATPVALRVTTVYRREEDGWKLVHRHADPITTARPIESLAQE